MDTANWTITESGLTSSQPGHVNNPSRPSFECLSTDPPESMPKVDSPISEPRQDPTNQSLPEILVTDYSPSKSVLDWSVSSTSLSVAASDLPQNTGEISGQGSPSWTRTCPNTESSIDENMLVNGEVVSSSPNVTDLSSGKTRHLKNTSSIDPASSSAFSMTSSSETHNHVAYLNGVAPSDDLPLLGVEAFQRESSEPTAGDSDEEYFEEFHLPNTHENAFVRHLSFRRRVQTTPIHAPDAERIEGLVRTGEFVRHGSIRKKILPEEPLQEQYEDGEEEEIEDKKGDQNDSSFSRRIKRDLREIERYLSEDNLADTSYNVSYDQQVIAEHPVNARSNCTTSTPKSTPAPVAGCRYHGNGDLTEDVCNSPVNKDPKVDVSLDPQSNLEEESSNIEESTIRKIQDCLDFSSYRDMLNLSGRLSDILSPMEVEEVLSHSERYRHYLDSEVIEALSLSFRGQTQSLPYTINTTSPHDSCSVSNRVATSQGLCPVAGQVGPNADIGFSSLRSPQENKDFSRYYTTHLPADDLLLVRRPSVAFDGIGAQGIFVESASGANSELRKISAPRINLDWSTDSKQDSTGDGEGFQVESTEEELGTSTSRKRIHVSSETILGELNSHDEFVSVASEATEHNATMHTAFLSIPTELPPDAISHAPPPPDLIPELTAAEELSDIRHWRNVVIGGAWRRIDMRVIAPYRKCISHGGYMEDSQSPIVVLSAALLPDRSRKDYHYVMDNLFIYVLSFLEQLVADDYVLVYFSEDLHQRSAPGFHWLRRAYQMIDRRLRKNLKVLLLVHPSLWARTILTLSRPFVSSKFYRKLHYVRHLIDLAQLVPLEQLEIPDIVKQADFEIMIREKKNGKTRR